MNTSRNLILQFTFFLFLLPPAVAKEVSIPLPPAEDFTTTIDNPYWPLPLGASFLYFAETEEGCEYNKVSVVSNGDTVMGYPVLTLRDQAWVHEPEEGEECDPTLAVLEEDTLDYLSQDSDGNIWYFGEDTLSYDDDGFCTDEGAWLAGDNEAEAGILMLGAPAPGMRYRQEYLADEAEDWGAVLRVNGRVTIELGDYQDCLVTKEWTPLEPGAIEHKFYCPEPGNPGPGLVLIEERKGKSVYVEYVGTGDFGITGEYDPFPALVCPPE